MSEETRRLDRLEERLNQAERDVTALNAIVKSLDEDLSRRIVNINNNLKDDNEKMRIDMRERLDQLREDIKDNIADVGDKVNTLSNDIHEVNKSISKLYTGQRGAESNVKTNEKIIWGVVTLIGMIIVSIIQGWIKNGGLG